MCPGVAIWDWASSYVGIYHWTKLIFHLSSHWPSLAHTGIGPWAFSVHIGVLSGVIRILVSYEATLLRLYGCIFPVILRGYDLSAGTLVLDLMVFLAPFP